MAAGPETTKPPGTARLASSSRARRRAFDGVEEPVFYRGKVCGRVRKHSDTLLMFLLKARDPEKFKDRVATELSGRVSLTHEQWLDKLK